MFFFEIELNPFSIIIGENDAGKSNLLEAMQLVLSNNSIDYFSKALKISDINKNALGTFIFKIADKSNDLLQALKEKKDVKEFIEIFKAERLTKKTVKIQNRITIPA